MCPLSRFGCNDSQTSTIFLLALTCRFKIWLYSISLNHFYFLYLLLSFAVLVLIIFSTSIRIFYPSIYLITWSVGHGLHVSISFIGTLAWNVTFSFCRWIALYLSIIFHQLSDFVGSLRCWTDYCLNWRQQIIE